MQAGIMSLLLLLTGTDVRCGQKSWGLQCEAIGVFLQLLGKCEPPEIIDCEGLCTVLKFCLLFSASEWVMLWSTEAARYQWHSSYRDQVQILSHCRQYLQFSGIALLSGGMAEQLHSKRRYSSGYEIGYWESEVIQLCFYVINFFFQETVRKHPRRET